MQKAQLGCWSLVALILLATLAGALGGAVVGGTIGYRAAQGTATATPAREPTKEATAVAKAVESPTVAATPTPTSRAVATPTVPGAATARLRDDGAITSVVRKVGPAVVTVVTTLPQQIGLFGVTEAEAKGSGVIFRPDGYIVTNNHVVEGAKELNVILADGQKLRGTLVGRDELSDLAVVKIDKQGLAWAEMGDSSALEPGQTVIAIGSALGDFRNTITVGVVSGLERSIQRSEDFTIESLIQTDAAINKGNSGGPLLNGAGQVVGINTLVLRGTETSDVIAEGLGFAIPSNVVRTVVDELIKNGRVPRPYISGITYVAVSPQLASYYDLSAKAGILVTRVRAGTPASDIDLKRGDVVTQIGNEPINERNPYLNVLMRHKVGETVRLVVNRFGRQMEIEVRLTERP